MSERLTRRSVLGAAGVLGLASAGAARGEDTPKSCKDYFGGGTFELVTPDSIKPKSYSTNVSPDGLAFTILFDSLQIVAGGKALTSLKTACLTIPFTLPAGKRLVGFVQDVRGYVSTTTGARAALVADLGGNTQVRDFPAGEEPTAKNFIHSFITDRRLEGGPDGPILYTINFLLTAQRRTTTDQVVLAVDSLDVEAILFASEAPKRTPAPFKKRPANP